MPCTPFRLPDGTRGFVCTRGRGLRLVCSHPGCGRASAYQCDYPAGRGTCSRHLCASHAHQVGPDEHLCAEHRDAPIPGAQASLF